MPVAALLFRHTRPSQPSRVRGLALVAVLAAIAAALAHDLVYLATFGSNYSAAMDQTGHDGRWAPSLLTILFLAMALVVAAVLRLRTLSRLAYLRTAGSSVANASIRALIVDAARLWAPIAGIGLLFFVAEENLELVLAGSAPPGIDVPGITGSFAAPLLIAAVSFAVALVAALYRWRTRILDARIAAAGIGAGRGPSSIATRGARRSGRLVDPMASGWLAGRAPPLDTGALRPISS